MGAASGLDARQVGIALALAGSVLFACKAILIKLAYGYGVSSIALLGLRMAFSLPLFLLIGYSRRQRSGDEAAMRPRDVLGIAALGLCGYYVASYTDFLGLRYVTAGMERVILFVYPTVVLLIERYVFGKPIRRVQALATVLCYAGIVVAFSGSDLRVGSDFSVGAALIFTSAVTFAAYAVGSGHLTPRFGSVRFTSVAMVSAAIAVITHALLSGEQLLGLPVPVYAYGIALAIFCTVVPTYLLAEGFRRVGASDTAILGAVGPLATVVLEYYVLGESINVVQGLGAVLVVGGVVMIGRAKASTPARATA